jgi:hypothetical protein
MECKQDIELVSVYSCTESNASGQTMGAVNSLMWRELIQDDNMEL